MKTTVRNPDNDFCRICGRIICYFAHGKAGNIPLHYIGHKAIPLKGMLRLIEECSYNDKEAV